VVLLIAGGGAGTIAAGYVFGTVTYFALRVCFRYRRHPGRSRFHEAAFSGATINAVWKKLGRESSQEEAAEAALYGVVAFDHGVLREEFPGIHEWLVRRWTGFAVAAISAIALLFSFEMGLWIGIHPSVSWLLPWGVFTVVLVGVAWSAQRDGERMIRFMAEKPPIRHLKSQSDARSVAVRSDLR
jgi:hypothetical protein